MSNPIFSLIHPTARVPYGWIDAFNSWVDNCDNFGQVEYLLTVHESDLYEELPKNIVVCTGRKCWVDSVNQAARVSTGNILIVIADDLFPCSHWDTELHRVIPDASRPYAVHVETHDLNTGIIVMPILTRSYYEQPGRGGHPNGELLYPDYLSMGADDDFTHCAYRDGVVIDAKGIHFDHRHYTRGLATLDEVYKYQASPEAWDTKHRVLRRREAENFSR